MRSQYVRSLGPDQLELMRPARPGRLVFPALAVAAFCAGVTFTGGGLMIIIGLVGLVLMPLVGIKAVRSAVSRRHVLVRTPGRLLLDGEPIEAARVELRVLKHWLLRRPHRYALSLWALVGRGEQLDIELGHHSTMLEASMLSGQMEEFLERAKQRAAGRATPS